MSLCSLHTQTTKLKANYSQSRSDCKGDCPPPLGVKYIETLYTISFDNCHIILYSDIFVQYDKGNIILVANVTKPIIEIFEKLTERISKGQDLIKTISKSNVDYFDGLQLAS